MSISSFDIRHFVLFSCNRKLAIEIRNFCRGGIAQLVERQLCKLEVRGSNPLASIFAQRKCHAVVPQLRDEGGRFIFDLRFAIADLSKCGRSAPRNQIENRQSKFENSAVTTAAPGL
jgi:hypothetical protein